ncbi:hypothetical protein FACS189426_20630 [Bacteroidia bacterium]|nr:hypothetical protein FACS189426_20630 [Bacteroidia bacterium]
METVNRNALQIISFGKKRFTKQLLKGSLTFIIILASGYLFMSAQKKPSIYKKGWIDFNKNGVMDVYENPEAATVMVGNSSQNIKLTDQFTVKN